LSKFVNNLLEVTIFTFLTAIFYCLYIVTTPIFKEPHCFLVMSELSGTLPPGLLYKLIFGSAIICVLLGVIVLHWISFFSPEVMANFWTSTYIFIWIDTVLTISVKKESFKILVPLGIGLFFIYIFFISLNFLNFGNEKNKTIDPWKILFLNYWFWGWMGFYFGLSVFLTFNSFYNHKYYLFLATASMMVCFLNYLLCLFIKRASGKDVESFSRKGRLIFLFWFFSLILIWVGQKWKG